MADENDSPHLSAEQARAGATPHMTRYVLGFGLLLAIIAMVFILKM